MKNYTLFSKIILRNIEVYLQKERDEGILLPDIASRLKMQCGIYMAHRPFSKSEAQEALAMMDTDEFRVIVENDVSFLLFALEMARLYVERIPKKHRAILNISDKKLRLSYRAYVSDMLRLKHSDIDRYRRAKSTIDDTRDMSTKFFDYIYQQIIGEPT